LSDAVVAALVGGIVGAVVSGLFSFVVLRITLRHAREQAERAEDERERVRRADRLRALYADYIRTANALVGQASVLPIALIEADRGRPHFLEQLQLDEHVNTSHLDAPLSLEGETDRAVRTEFGLLSNDYLSFLLRARHKDGELQMSDEEYVERIEGMRQRALTLTALAQQRLDTLEARPTVDSRPS
jgi:hypothetical protein